nr:hypothetical protein Q903MT_gene1506 [Picea sitchensis]
MFLHKPLFRRECSDQPDKTIRNPLKISRMSPNESTSMVKIALIPIKSRSNSRVKATTDIPPCLI